MLDMSYDREGIQAAVGGKPAYIDTGNTSIQVPSAEFEALRQHFLAVDPTVHPQVVDGARILMSKQPCDSLEGLYKGI